MPAANDVKSIDLAGQRPRCVLAIARRRTNRVDNLGLSICFCADGLSNFEKSFQFDRGLRNHKRSTQGWKQCDFCRITNDVSIVWSVTDYSNHFRVIGIPGNDDIASLFGGSLCEMLYSRNKRTGRVDYFGRPLFKFMLNLGRNAMSANDCY